MQADFSMDFKPDSKHFASNSADEQPNLTLTE